MTTFRLEPLELGFKEGELDEDLLTVPFAFTLTIRGVVTQKGFDFTRLTDGLPLEFWKLDHDETLQELFNLPIVEFAILPLERKEKED